MTREKIYHRKPDTISGKLDEQLVMMDIEKGKYFSMNPVATRVWELLEVPQSLENLCKLLTEEYDVTPEQCRDEVGGLIKKMESLGLLTSDG